MGVEVTVTAPSPAASSVIGAACVPDFLIVTRPA